MIKNYLIFILFCFYASCLKSAEDGFGKQIFEEPPPEKIEQTTTKVMDDNDIVKENVHPLLRYDLNRYLVIGTFLQLGKDNRSLAIIRVPEGTDHIVFLEDILSNNEPLWTVKEINLRGIVIQQEKPENSDENDNPLFLKKNIDVNNPQITITEMNNN